MLICLHTHMYTFMHTYAHVQSYFGMLMPKNNEYSFKNKTKCTYITIPFLHKIILRVPVLRYEGT